MVIRDIRSLFEHKANYYKPGRASGFWRNNYGEYGSNGDRNKTLSIQEYLNKVRPYLKDITNDLKKSNLSKTNLTIAINFISSKDKDKERVMHSYSDNT